MRSNQFIKLIILIFFILLVFLFSIRLMILSPSKKAESLVNDFYSFEQDGKYSDSWDLLHPFMKEKFPKSAFIQDRAHVFNGHFGSETFSYSIGDSTEVNGWKPANREKPFENAYKFIVTQDYTGKYGKFSFSQHVYVVKYKKELVILWDYNK